MPETSNGTEILCPCMCGGNITSTPVDVYSDITCSKGGEACVPQAMGIKPDDAQKLSKALKEGLTHACCVHGDAVCFCSGTRRKVLSAERLTTVIEDVTCPACRYRTEEILAVLIAVVPTVNA